MSNGHDISTPATFATAGLQRQIDALEARVDALEMKGGDADGQGRNRRACTSENVASPSPREGGGRSEDGHGLPPWRVDPQPEILEDGYIYFSGGSSDPDDPEDMRDLHEGILWLAPDTHKGGTVVEMVLTDGGLVRADAWCEGWRVDRPPPGQSAFFVIPPKLVRVPQRHQIAIEQRYAEGRARGLAVLGYPGARLIPGKGWWCLDDDQPSADQIAAELGITPTGPAEDDPISAALSSDTAHGVPGRALAIGVPTLSAEDAQEAADVLRSRVREEPASSDWWEGPWPEYLAQLGRAAAYLEAVAEGAADDGDRTRFDLDCERRPRMKAEHSLGEAQAEAERLREETASMRQLSRDGGAAYLAEIKALRARAEAAFAVCRMIVEQVTKRHAMLDIRAAAEQALRAEGEA